MRAAINAPEAHSEMHGLMQSIADHSRIPSTFDGELDVYSQDDAPVRIAVGSRYLFPDNKEQGSRVGLVTSTTVSEEGVAHCAVSFGEKEAGAIYTYPLSKEELDAYGRHPDTFFGVPSQRKTRVKSPLELYDFFHESYRHTPKERLLEFMPGRTKRISQRLDKPNWQAFMPRGWPQAHGTRKMVCDSGGSVGVR